MSVVRNVINVPACSSHVTLSDFSQSDAYNFDLRSWNYYQVGNTSRSTTMHVGVTVVCYHLLSQSFRLQGSAVLKYLEWFVEGLSFSTLPLAGREMASPSWGDCRGHLPFVPTVLHSLGELNGFLCKAVSALLPSQ